jgi:hypothetical protein
MSIPPSRSQDRTPPRLLRDAGLALGYLQTQIVYLLIFRFQLLPVIESHVSEPQQDAIRTCAGCLHLNACLTHDPGFKFWEVWASRGFLPTCWWGWWAGAAADALVLA